MLQVSLCEASNFSLRCCYKDPGEFEEVSSKRVVILSLWTPLLLVFQLLIG